MVEEHGGEMSARDMKDARKVPAEFEFEEVGIGGRRGRHDREREREAAPHHEPGPPGPPPPARLNRRREGFGAHLTNDPGLSTAPSNSPGPSRLETPSPPPSDVDPIVAEYAFSFFGARHSLILVDVLQKTRGFPHPFAVPCF
jgi:hypothetical protein